MKRLSLVPLLAVIAFAALIGSAADASKHKSTKPKEGQYQAAPDTKGDYYGGAWSLVKDGSKFVMVPYDSYAGVAYPAPAKCAGGQLLPPEETVPVSATGRFHYKRSFSKDDGYGLQFSVDWKGKWKSSRRVEGKVKITAGASDAGSKPCKESYDWLGNYALPLAPGTVAP